MADGAAWVSALAAIGALGAAVWAGRSAKQLYLVESRRDEVAAEREAAEAARRVSAWIAIHLPNGRSDDQGRVDGMILTNAGTTPIFDIEVTSNDYTGRAQRDLHLSVLPPGEYFTQTESTYGWTFPDPTKAFSGLIRPITRKEEWRVTGLTFMDASGLRWRRDETGRLDRA